MAVLELERVETLNLLYDFYGKFLTEKQREAFELYYEEDLTLAEIAERLGVSRQAVHASLKLAEKKLKDHEDKLGLAKEYMDKSRPGIEDRS